MVPGKLTWSIDIMTPFLQRVIETTGDVTWLEKASPFNMLGQPKDIGNAVVWLASGRESGYVTGIDLSVDGGFLAR
jgi:NAD(P)-dependent dehydrogenase (short-subunit alcohol dehydrogenase family)